MYTKYLLLSANTKYRNGDDIVSIGERIRYFRTLKGVTQKYLGVQIGLSSISAEVRIAQYENGVRTPKPDRIKEIAKVLNVSYLALEVPDLDTELGLIHTLFVLEDLYGLSPCELNGEFCLRLDKHKATEYIRILRILNDWKEQFAKVESGVLTVENYNHWRYWYPELDPRSGFIKIL